MSLEVIHNAYAVAREIRSLRDGDPEHDIKKGLCWCCLEPYGERPFQSSELARAGYEAYLCEKCAHSIERWDGRIPNLLSATRFMDLPIAELKDVVDEADLLSKVTG